MKFHRQLQPATGTSWVVSYSNKTIPRWRTAAILKFDISPYLSEKSTILMKFCTQQQILYWMNVMWSKMKKLHWTDSEFDTTYFLFFLQYCIISLITTHIINAKRQEMKLRSYVVKQLGDFKICKIKHLTNPHVKQLLNGLYISVIYFLIWK